MATTSAVKTRWYRLILGAVSMFFAGIIYAWSILKAPLAVEFGWSAADLALNFTLMLCFWCIGGVISSQITRRTSPRVTVTLSAVVVLAGFFLCSRMSGNSIMMLYFSYGGLAGIGIGMSYNAVISATSAWFPDKKGTCSGVMMMCFGISSLVLGSVADRMFAMPAFGWRKTYLVLGIVIAAVLAISGQFVKTPGPDVVLPKPSAKQSVQEAFESRDYSASEMLRRFTFWRFFLFCALTASVGSTVISFARDLSLAAGADAVLATTLVGVLSVCNGLGRVICGMVFDILGRRKTMLLASVITIVAPAVVLISLSTNSLVLCIVGLCFTGISYGFAPTITSAFTSAFYGLKYFPTNFSIANMMLIPASFSATLASTLLMNTGSYTAPFIMLFAFACVALILNLSIRRP